jgi:hypothetical protein
VPLLSTQNILLTYKLNTLKFINDYLRRVASSFEIVLGKTTTKRSFKGVVWAVIAAIRISKRHRGSATYKTLSRAVGQVGLQEELDFMRLRISKHEELMTKMTFLMNSNLHSEIK